MFVVQQMELVERWSRNLPMRLLVKIAEGDGVSQELIQLLSHLQPDRLFQFQWQQMLHGAVGLNFSRALMQTGLRAHFATIGRNRFLLSHGESSLRAKGWNAGQHNLRLG